jgi:hypothetical protein
MSCSFGQVCPETWRANHVDLMRTHTFALVREAETRV